MHNFKVILLLLLLIFMSSCRQNESIRPPNIVFIMCDDLGYNELGCYGQDIIRTPHIDQLAREGIRFTQFYSGSPVCAPSRCVLLTGKHTGHAYIRDNYELGGYTDETEGGQLPLPPEIPTIGDMLKQKGYVTAAIGKWGLGGPHSVGIPNRHGFDYFYGYLCQKQAHNYYPSHLWENDSYDTLQNQFFMAHQKLNGEPTDPDSYRQFVAKDYAPDKMLEKAIEFIRNNHDTSFFLYLPLTVPHLALQVPLDDPFYEKYKEIVPDTPYTGDRGYLPHQFPKAAYAAMITRMDSDVGKILNLLKKLELENNTIVFFTSDNGPTYGGIGGSDTKYFKSNNPFSGLKGSLHEGGIRVPLIVRWPGKIKKGLVSDHISAFWDVFPTLDELSGPESEIETDGISFIPELTSESQSRHPYLYWEFPAYGGQVAVRMGQWKGIRKGLKENPLRALELYNLENDTAELNDVAHQFPEVVIRLSEIIDSARHKSEMFPFPALDSSGIN